MPACPTKQRCLTRSTTSSCLHSMHAHLLKQVPFSRRDRLGKRAIHRDPCTLPGFVLHGS